MTEFLLHPRLAADCHAVGDLPLCRVLLFDDSRYPWIVLVPRRPGLREIYDLAAADRATLFEEVSRVGEELMRVCPGDKLNLGALGNLVPQLHLHLVVRSTDDPAWPGPVWGHSAAQAYAADALGERLALLREALGLSA
jgi:diadenosine tetraphosphate (Ap4A) HIT family hydrolase